MTRKATIGLAAFLAGVASVGLATEMTWQGTCGSTGWFDTCHIGQCGGGENRLFNNWGQESCAPAQPAFPGQFDIAVLPASAVLGSGDADVGWLTLPLDQSVLDVSGQTTDVIVGNQLTNWGLIELHDEGGIEVWGGSITNNGTIKLRYGGYAGGGVLEVPVDVTLGGSGSLVLQSGGDSRIEGGGALTHAAGHTIRGGAGSIIAPLVNQGLVNADVDGGSISLTDYFKTNNAMIEASNGSEVRISTTVTQGAAGQLVADGADSFVRLMSGASITGGTLASPNGGKLWTSGGGVIVQVADLTNTAYWGIENGSTVGIGGSVLTNDGTIEAGLYTGGSGWPQLLFSPGVTLAGSGDLKTSKAYLRGGPFTNAATHTIHGWNGTIEAEMVNHGTVDSDTAGQVMTLSGSDKTNHGLIRASNGGDVNVSTEVTQGATGQIVADGAESFVNLGTGAHIVGGTMATVGGGKTWTTGTVTPEVTDVTLVGYWGIENGAQPVFTGATLTNNGTIEAGLYMGFYGPPVLHVESPLALVGSGELLFSGGRLATAAGVTWSNGAGHTIHGTSGSFAASLVNRGTIAADWSGQELRLYAQEPGITNEGHIRADAGCTLRLYAANLFTQAAGETRVEGSLELSGGPLDLAGGRLVGGGTVYGSVESSGGTVSPGSSVGTLTVDGDYTQGAAGQLLVELAGTGAGQYDVLEVDGAASLGGSLYVTAAGGFQPQPGDSFTILEADVRTGEFDQVASWADSDCSLGFDVTYNAGTVVITAVDGAASVFCSNLESGGTSDWSNAVP